MVLLLFVFLTLGFGACEYEQDEIFYSNSWAVEVSGGADFADILANKHGFINRGQVGNLAGIYHFTHTFTPTRVKRRSNEIQHRLSSEIHVGYVEQQVVKKRHKRSDFYSPPSSKSWKKQWYLHRSSGHHMNVEKVWQQNITGRGAVISILDDGIEYTHPDLQANYDPLASYDFNDHDADPFPRYDPTNENKHGTRCAGEVVGVRNGQCGVGASYGAKVGGVRMLDGDVTDVVEASSLSLRPQHIHVYSSSWGPNDDGATVDGPGILASKAFMDGVTNGRNGLGSIYVWAAGNGGRYGDSCNCDGYAVSPLTVSVASASEHDDKPWYLEQCSSTLTSTYSSGGSNERQIVTTDLHHRCTDRHTGTSASAPLAAAMIALALEANPGLTWRDVQYLMVYSSNPSYCHDNNWVRNGAGLKVSHWYGYGIIDGAALVNRARNWISVPQRRSCTVNMTTEIKNKEITSTHSITIEVNSCNIVYLEHVQVITTLNILPGGFRKDISLFLTSPAGTKSTLLPFRQNDRHKDGFHLWPFMTVHSWGERSEGRWIFSIELHRGTKVVVNALELILYGTLSVPDSVQAIPSLCDPQCLRGCAKKGPFFCDACKHYQMNGTLECVEKCPLEFYESLGMCYECPPLCAECDREHVCSRCLSSFLFLNGTCHTSCPEGTFASSDSMCISCHQSCLTCDGPHDNSCMGCHPQFVLKEGMCIMRDATSCLNGEYFDHRAHECRLCHESCALCSGGESTHCTTCHEGHVNRGGQCIDSRQLRSCDNGHYFDASHLECASCPVTCANCSDNLTCTSCPEPLYLTKGNVCVKQCPPHTISDDVNSLCIDTCHVSCLTCTNTSENCLSCAPGLFLMNYSCVEVCPTNYYSDSGDGFCKPCLLNCAVCQGPSSCHFCQEEYAYYAPNQSCLLHCPDGYYLSRNRECLPCESPCSTCAGTSLNCSTCKLGMALDTVLQQCIQCCNPDISRGSCCDCDLDDRICYMTNYTEIVSPPVPTVNTHHTWMVVLFVTLTSTFVLCLILAVLLIQTKCRNIPKTTKYLQVPIDIVDAGASDSDINIYTTDN